MKHFWLIVIMLCINLSCSNDLLFVTGTTNYIFRDLAYDVNRYVKLYYCDYLKYPTVLIVLMTFVFNHLLNLKK